MQVVCKILKLMAYQWWKTKLIQAWKYFLCVVVIFRWGCRQSFISEMYWKPWNIKLKEASQTPVHVSATWHGRLLLLLDSPISTPVGCLLRALQEMQGSCGGPPSHPTVQVPTICSAKLYHSQVCFWVPALSCCWSLPGGMCWGALPRLPTPPLGLSSSSVQYPANNISVHGGIPNWLMMLLPSSWQQRCLYQWHHFLLVGQ